MKKKKKGKKIDEEGYFEIFKGLRKIYILEVRMLYLLKPYLFFIVVLNIVNGNLGLSRVDRKAQGPLKLVSYWSFLVPLQATHLSPIGKAQKASPIR